MDERVAARLRAWVAAGLIDTPTAEAITRFESGAAAAAPAPGASIGERMGPAEALSYIGVAVVLAGILYGVFTGFGSSAAGPVVLALAAAGAGLGILLRRGEAPSSRRSAGAVLAVAAGLAALGVGQVLVSSGVFATTTQLPFNITERQQNDAALTAIASGAALALALVALAVVAIPLTALLAVAAAYTAALSASVAIGGEAGVRVGVAPLTVAAFLLLLAPRYPADITATLRFGAALVTPPALLLLGGIDGAPAWPLIAAATLCALAAMRGAVRLGSNALAVAGGIGVFATSVDVADRTLGGSGRAPVVLIVSGLLLIGCAALTQQAIKRTRARTAA